ncbi:MAG: hypothetical protein ABW092_07425 [Candidatus Thiodiazotropha sp.]
MRNSHRRSFIRQLPISLGFGLSLLMTGVMVLAESGGYRFVPVKDSPEKTIAVFDFELIDQSAGGGVVAKDAIDIENLKLSTQKGPQHAR